MEISELKFTDEEIIKAAECCGRDGLDNCDQCPFRGKSCAQLFPNQVLDLINRQKEEIEKLREELGDRKAKKAKISIHGTTDWNTRCRCPVCDKDLFDGQKFCSECGQRIDWGKEQT